MRARLLHMTLLHRMILVQGRVQGVGYRASAMDEAKRLGLSGTARNVPSGGVEIHVEGSSEQIEAFTHWAGRGPALARVDELQFTDGPPIALTGERIIR